MNKLDENDKKSLTESVFTECVNYYCNSFPDGERIDLEGEGYLMMWNFMNKFEYDNKTNLESKFTQAFCQRVDEFKRDVSKELN